MANDLTRKKTRINATDARRIAVKAMCDPRVVKSALAGERTKVSSASRERAKQALRDDGYAVPEDDDV